MNGQGYIDDSLLQFRKLKDQADRAIVQIAATDLFDTLDPESNSIAIIMKHLAGNMRSRWTDFLTSDGEKATRNRDGEFETAAGDTKERVIAAWEEGWSLTFAAISSLQPDDLDRTVTIRGEAHSVLQAVNRQIAHYGVHVGQITFLARHYAGAKWRSLSIPRGKSKEFEVTKRGEPFAIRETTHETIHTSRALLDIHARAQRNLAALLAHCRQFTTDEINREFPGFGYATARLQIHHVIGAEKYWLGVLEGRIDAEEDDPLYPTVASLEAYHVQVFDAIEAYLHATSATDLNTPRPMKTWGGREPILVPAQILIRTMVHLYHHAGQVAAICRLLGKPVKGLDYPITPD